MTVIWPLLFRSSTRLYIGKNISFPRTYYTLIYTEWYHTAAAFGTKIKRYTWRHNGHDTVSNHQPHDCLLNRLFGRNQRKHQFSASLAFVQGIHRGPVNYSHKWPVTLKVFPFDDLIMTRTSVRSVYYRAGKFILNYEARPQYSLICPQFTSFISIVIKSSSKRYTLQL